MLLNCGVGEDSCGSLGEQGDPTSPSYGKSVLYNHLKDWCWSWNLITLATWWEELTHVKRPWCWEWLKVGGERDDRGWDAWMSWPTQWTQVWVNSGSWWWTGKPGVLQFIGSQRVNQDWVTGLNWTYSSAVSGSVGVFFSSFHYFTMFAGLLCFLCLFPSWHSALVLFSGVCFSCS